MGPRGQGKNLGGSGPSSGPNGFHPQPVKRNIAKTPMVIKSLFIISLPFQDHMTSSGFTPRIN
jgi:hypothetical protein